MKTIQSFFEWSIDFLAAIVLASVVAILTPLIIDQEKSLNYTFVYIWLVSLILIILLLLKIYQSHRNRVFSERFRNEKEAMPTLAILASKTNAKLCILSKVGTSIFFAFQNYSFALEKGLNLQVLVVDPNDQSLIELMNRIYVQQENISKRWTSMLSELRAKLDEIHERFQLPKASYEKVRDLLDEKKNENKGYQSLIMASIMMWDLAEDIANKRLAEAGTPLTTHGLDIRTYNVLPDIKAWFFDDSCCALGNYDALHLGRDNPIDLYQPKNHHGLELWQFENVLEIWKYKFSKAQKFDVSSLKK
ncbi:membrane protein [Beggiatoa sp. PS]|nr:membrane protein [Beggiatoa sp. PS]